jgi:hypothetical protein
MQYIRDCQMQIKFAMHRRVFMELSDRKNIRRILKELLYLLHSQRKAEKLHKGKQIFANFHLERA